MLIAGLGNPGLQYEKSRHNIGFMLVDYLRSQYGCEPIKKASFKGELFRCQSNFLLKPMTFMNLSGQSIAPVKAFYKIEDVLVVHDDLDLPFGAIRFKFGGGSGGHNGIKSTDAMIGNDYWRLRIGIGKPAHRSEVVNFVLGDFPSHEIVQMPHIFEHCRKAIEACASNSMEDVRAQFNVKSIEQLLT